MKKGMLFQVSIYLLSLSILAALYTFLIIPQVRRKTENRYKNVIADSVNNYLPVLIYKGDTPLLSGCIVTDVNRDNFKVEMMPAYCIVNNAISDFEMINDRELMYTITGGQQMSFDIISLEGIDYSEMKRLKEYKVSSLVGEHAKKGTYVDILARYPDGSYDVLIQKIRIYDILRDENGYVKDSEGYYTILLAVDEDEFRALESALLIGYLDTRLYLLEKEGLAVSISKNCKWVKLINKVSGALTDIELYMSVYNTDVRQAEAAISMMSELKDLAARGDFDARCNIIDYYVRVLSSGKLFDVDKETASLINFNNISNNEPQIIFELLLANRRLGELIDKYKIEDKLSAVELAEIASKENIDSSITYAYRTKRERTVFFATILYAFAYGQDCLDCLQNQDINEIGVLNKDYVYVTYKGKKIRLLFLSFDSVGTIINIQKKTTQNSSLNYDRQNPIIVTSKNNSSRISVSGYDVTPTDEDAYYNERIFNLKQITLEEMRDKYQTINESIYMLLMMNQLGRGSFFVTGSDMGVGKSTFLLSMLEKYPDTWGIGILDQQNELQTGKKYPSKNVITLVENARKNLSECFAYLLKTSRDVLVVSEITMPDEVSELVNAALRLNAGVCATMHSYSPYEVIPNLRNLMLRTPMYQDKNTAEEDIAGSIDLIIHLGRLNDGRIKVMSIHEIFLEKDTYVYEKECSDYRDMKMMLVRLGVKGLRDLVLGRRYSLREITRFDIEKDDWVNVNRPSDSYLKKVSRYANKELINKTMFFFDRGEQNVV